ncbi:MAG: 5-guanidino-2-oxopentanoate decarboxylase [Pseudomonadota bacterium]
MKTLGIYLADWLATNGVDTIFGIPGVHTVELYRGLDQNGLTHITPRHEQGAGFMADGYARVTGKPGVCFIITGPGMTNIATAMGQALGDSIPMLVISTVNETATLGRGLGELHELPDQRGLVSGVARWSETVRSVEALPDALARAFALFACERPGPVHIELPLDLIAQDASHLPAPEMLLPPSAGAGDAEALQLAVRAVEAATQPVLLVGGGARHASIEVRRLAERLDAPVIMTVNARGALPHGHPLAVQASPSLLAVRDLFAGSDLVIAVGTEFGWTDFGLYDQPLPDFDVPMIRIDIDPGQLWRSVTPDVAIAGDARAVLAGLYAALGLDAGGSEGESRAEAARTRARDEIGSAYRGYVALLEAVRDALPEVAMIGDSTQFVYAGNCDFAATGPNRWFNSATGYGTLGYALPAAIGASIGAGKAPVVCLAGDGGLQFTLAELGSAIDARTPIILVVLNNYGYGEIKSYMQERQIPTIGVDLHTPDFQALAIAYGWQAEMLQSLDQIGARVAAAAAAGKPTLIEIDGSLFGG